MIKKIINRLFYPNLYSSKAYRNYLVNKGAIIGKNTFFYSPKNTFVDLDNCHFITIGDYCKITSGVRILSHDYSYSVLRRVYHDIPKKAAVTKIGNNCFIGMNSIILMGANIGDNVIIGAGSVVSGNIPDNTVWAGNPAKFICNLEDYYKKCKSKFEEGARITVKQYNERFNRNPSIYELQYFSTLFLNNDSSSVKFYRNMMFNGDNKQEVERDASKIKSKYCDYEDFINNMKN